MRLSSSTLTFFAGEYPFFAACEDFVLTSVVEPLSDFQGILLSTASL
jgi:hypothetical protein